MSTWDDDMAVRFHGLRDADLERRVPPPPPAPTAAEIAAAEAAWARDEEIAAAQAEAYAEWCAWAE